MRAQPSERSPRPNAVALRVWGGWLGALDADGLGAGLGGLGPVVVLRSLEPVVGHFALDDTGLGAEPSGGQESFQEVFLEYLQGSDQELRGKNRPG